MNHPSDDHLIPAGKFQRLLDYLDHIETLDTEALARQAGLNRADIDNLPPRERLPSRRYARLYEIAANEMQRTGRMPPWGAGIGTDVFRFMCYSIVSCTTLGEALKRAQRFEQMLFPQTGHRIELVVNDSAELHYHISEDAIARSFSPDDWDRTPYSQTVARGSALRIWYAFMGWLVGRNLDLERVDIAASYVTDAYAESLYGVFQVPVHFETEYTALYFSKEQLDFRMVHSPESMESFLDNAIYWLIAQDKRPASTGAAVKSLLARAGGGAPPTFEAMAESLHLSPSSLRRRLQKEGTTYQALKDRYRSETAQRHLREGRLKIHEIGELLGFLEPSSFIRSFRSWTGVTPKQFQRGLED